MKKINESGDTYGVKFGQKTGVVDHTFKKGKNKAPKQSVPHSAQHSTVKRVREHSEGKVEGSAVISKILESIERGVVTEEHGEHEWVVFAGEKYARFLGIIGENILESSVQGPDGRFWGDILEVLQRTESLERKIQDADTDTAADATNAAMLMVSGYAEVNGYGIRSEAMAEVASAFGELLIAASESLNKSAASRNERNFLATMTSLLGKLAILLRVPRNADLSDAADFVDASVESINVNPAKE